MEIKIFNFGPIKEFTVDLSKDLMGVYGKNNIGKSYAISVVYLVLKQFMEIDRFQLGKIIDNEVSDEKYQGLEKQIQKEIDCNITDQVCIIIKNILNSAVTERLENSLKNTYGSLNATKNFRCEGTPLIQLTLLNHHIQIDVGSKIQIKEFSSERNFLVKFSGDKIIFDFDSESGVVFKRDEIQNVNYFLRLFVSVLTKGMLEELTRQLGQIYFLPASRSGLYTGMQSLIPVITELSKSRAYITRKIDLPGMSDPIADYILLLSGISGIPTEHKEFSSIATEIEKEILGGEIGYDKDKTKLTYSPRGSSLTLDMNNVSSMVSELSPLAAFIKYLFWETSNTVYPNSKPVLFIEEPEAHLHPQAQVLLVEIFLKLVKAGVKVIFTSHSNYIFNKLSNMLMAGSLTTAQFAPIVLLETPEGSVSQLMESDQLGIEDENFMDTINALYQEREEIIEHLNQTADDQST